MTKGAFSKVAADVFLQTLQKKNPLKVMLSEGHIFKTLAFIAFSLVGTKRFELLTPTVSG
jgi:hypothetical protein